MVPVWWSYGLAAVGIAGIFLTIFRDWRGYAVGLAAQVGWVAYAIYTEQWGFIAAAGGYATVNVIGIVRWRHLIHALKSASGPVVALKFPQPWSTTRADPLHVTLHDGICLHPWPHTVPCEADPVFEPYDECHVTLGQLIAAGVGVIPVPVYVEAPPAEPKHRAKEQN